MLRSPDGVHPGARAPHTLWRQGDEECPGHAPAGRGGGL